jgi:FlaA1/EpsC-like NDP-sugar epimerase
MAVSAAIIVAVYGVMSYAFGLHRRMWRYASLPDALAIGATVAATTAVFSLIDLAVQEQMRPYWLSTVPSGAVLACLLLVTVKLWPRLTRTVRGTAMPATAHGAPRVLIVGAGEAGTLLARDFQTSNAAEGHVVAFVDDDPAKTFMRLGGVPVLGTRHDIPRLVGEHEIDLVAIAIPSSARNELDELLALCQRSGARVRIVPSLSEMATHPHDQLALRDLDIADLLGREEVRLDVEACSRYVEGKVVLVTGAAGSIGSELCRQLVHLRPSRLVLLDTNETGLFDLEAELHGLRASCELSVCMADIRDEQRVARVFAQYAPNVVFHAAAYKHVPLLQSHPAEAVKANVQGTAVLCRAAHDSGVERFVFISSDKAVAAANNLGYSKRIGELLVRAFSQNSQTVFCAVRFGNVVGSRGSVVPTFARQIAEGGPVTVTHPEVTRFFMSIPEAACLVIQAAANAHSGSIFMLDMGQPVPIVSLAEKMIRMRGLRVGEDIKIVYTGLRPGEKMHEELTTDLEDTLHTGHSKILEVVDPRFVSREGMEAAVRLLVSLSRDAGDADVSEALRRVSQGEPLAVPAPASEPAVAPALPRRALAEYLSAASLADALSLDPMSVLGRSVGGPERAVAVAQVGRERHAAGDPGVGRVVDLLAFRRAREARRASSPASQVRGDAGGQMNDMLAEGSSGGRGGGREPPRTALARASPQHTDSPARAMVPLARAPDGDKHVGDGYAH